MYVYVGVFSRSDDAVRWPVYRQKANLMREIADEGLARSPVRFVGQRPEDVKAHGDTERHNDVKVSATKMKMDYRICKE